MSDAPDIERYHERLDPDDRRVCAVLRGEIDRVLTGATSKVWHAHPVWFLDDNPIVGYDRLKDAIRLMFWSGQSFGTPGLTATGTFQAAEARYTAVEDIDLVALASWLEESRSVQWNYRDIRKTKGKLERLS